MRYDPVVFKQLLTHEQKRRTRLCHYNVRFNERLNVNSTHRAFCEIWSGEAGKFTSQARWMDDGTSIKRQIRD